MGLWATVTACEMVIEQEHEYIVVVNGREREEVHDLLAERAGVIFVGWHSPLPPPLARNMGASHAKGDILCFLDDHVLPTREFFQIPDVDVVHCSYKTYPRHPLRYFHYKFNPECPVKGDYATEPQFVIRMGWAQEEIPKKLSSYPCLSGPHGGFFVKRAFWEKIGGYDDFWQGFGGEEAYFGLKANLMGGTVVCEPNALFYHFSCRSGVRGYDKTFNEFNFEEGLKRLKAMGDLDGLLAANRSFQLG